MTLLLIESAYFWTHLNTVFDGIKQLFLFELNFPQPIGPLTPIDIMCTLAVMYMFADIAESYFGWTGNDGDNR